MLRYRLVGVERCFVRRGVLQSSYSGTVLISVPLRYPRFAWIAPHCVSTWTKIATQFDPIGGREPNAESRGFGQEEFDEFVPDA